ncbi:Glycosyltransferase [Melia azedarach]|uniref:Glycosyltransferase n=1 Tax=Melia azedarach TaxID=155640 RepID=A0ACC1Y3W2_MELAZ|nr:Glycosyltransferase [Melia azedarach]
MGSEASQVHFILFPFLAQGHLIPMIDIARLLAKHGVLVTVATTPVNAARFETVLARTRQSGLQIQVMELPFPFEEAGLPEGCENLDLLPSEDYYGSFYYALQKLQLPLENLFEKLKPPPSCIISDMCYPWTISVSRKFNVPRISFIGYSCSCLLCLHSLHISKVHENVSSDSEHFVVPGLPDKLEVTRSQLPEFLKNRSFGEPNLAADMASYGVLVNSFEELEQAYVEEYKKARNGKIWCIGPASLCNKDDKDKIERGKKASIDGVECLKWLDLQQPSSVVYVALGSLCGHSTSQLIELGLGLEASQKPFIWIIGEGHRSKGLEEWVFEEKFEERIKGRGLLIRGWAPQIQILSHPAIGGFLTHCGWNSLLEAISCGVPLVTWPYFGDQFLNEKLVVQVLKIGVRIGVEHGRNFAEERKNEALVKKEDIIKAINKLMDEGEERDERRRRVGELAEIAKSAIEEGGSSYLNIKLFIQDIMKESQSAAAQSNTRDYIN